MLQDFELEKLVEPLLEWFRGHARVLPWREEPTPYRVWVSEIMLQQTRVEAVKPYFERFTKALPDVQALAECPEDELLKLWEGLGYYNRVRNMQKAAIQVIESYGGVIPAEYEELLKLKGIGHYTAGAIASIAYGQYVPAVDGNVLRILTRATADNTDIMKQSFRSEIEQTLLAMMKQLTIPDALKKRLQGENIPGALNQAMMELGATVCVPNGAPLCGECPWQDCCLAKKEGRILELPVKSKAKARKIEKRTVLILRDGDKVAIRKRSSEGLLAGLYELPNVEGDLEPEKVLEVVKQMELVPIRIQKLAPAKHIFSHIEWHMNGYAILLEGTDMPKANNLLFVDADDASERYAIPAAFAAYAGYMNIKLGNERFEESMDSPE
ncbi:MAG: A/G-specific adenine glycosylase [Clostridiales bacterium]|nr:A/G-specific adenine glycosylase [Roseburia sp.]MDD7637652.1 A/G-specific adenine glycosylase [Clostridiales bacterium]MDY4113152.1 A/G-specific adenine glycosylase [Roseburia sp.]